jgi:hypothetical protein
MNGLIATLIDPKKNSTPKSKNFILMLPDLQSLKWNGHALLRYSKMVSAVDRY